MSVNKLPTNKTQVINAKYTDRGFVAYENRGSGQYVSQSPVETLVQWSNESVAVGTINSGDELIYTSSLNPTAQYSDQGNMGFNYLTVQIGSTAGTANQIYPSIGTATATDFQIIGGHDYLRVDNPYNSCFTLYVRNAGTASYVLYFYNRWQYIQNNSGASS